MISVVYISLLFTFVTIGQTTPIVEYDKGLRYEEYKVEHEISATQAKNAAQTLDLAQASPAGCQTCTSSEIKYCLGTDLISDHCCCDRRYHEVLSFIPHTCYEGPQVCRPVVGDCGEYRRLRSCCCDKHVLRKWKEKSGSRGFTSDNINLILTTILYLTVYILIFK